MEEDILTRTMLVEQQYMEAFIDRAESDGLSNFTFVIYPQVRKLFVDDLPYGVVRTAYYDNAVVIRPYLVWYEG
jgi:hypothetical protein